jgi:hypothetical protein
MSGYRGLTNEAMACKWICLKCDGDFVFQGITQMLKQITPYLINVHCVAHRTNLIVLMLSKLSLVVHIESML